MEQIKDEERALFEAWAVSMGLEVNVGEDNEYDNDRTMLTWCVWQAARASLLEDARVKAVPQGFALVPIEPTHKQYMAGVAAMDSVESAEPDFIFRAMLAAAIQGDAK